MLLLLVDLRVCARALARSQPEQASQAHEHFSIIFIVAAIFVLSNNSNSNSTIYCRNCWKLKALAVLRFIYLSRS